jgi:hypothetical protein
MNQNVSNHPDTMVMPAAAADAWAAVYIDVAEKLDAEQQRGTGEADQQPAEASPAPAA